jgi:hypothetical protein
MKPAVKQIYTLGFQVMASVENKKDFQPISAKFNSKAAAEDYKALAVKQGFKDAWVKEIEGFEPDLEYKAKRQKKEVRPKQAA